MGSAPISYIQDDDDDELLPNGNSLQQQQDESDFEQEVANNPGMAMVQTPKGPLPIAVQGNIPASDPQGGDDSQDPNQAQAAPMPPGARFGNTVPPKDDVLLQTVAQQPTMSHPKWWQRLGAAGFGAAAGWSNAASRTRNPIDIGAVGENILHPGYKQSMEEYQSKLNPIMQGYQIEAARNVQAVKNQSAQAKAQLENAQAAQNIARGAYWIHRAQTNPAEVHVAPNGTVVDIHSGKVLYAPQTKEEAVQARVASGMSLQDARMSVYNPTHFGVEQRPVVVPQGAAVMGADGKPTFTNPKPPKERDAVADELARGRMEEQRANENTRIDTGKQAAEQRLLQQRAHEITQLQNSGMPDDKLAASMAEINSRYAGQLQGVQNNYEQAVKGHGGNAEHFNVKVTPDGHITYEKAGGIPTPPPVTTPQQATPQVVAPKAQKQYSEGQVLVNPKTGEKVQLKGNRWVPITSGTPPK